MIVFANPGTLDIRAATIMGINVKESDNPIGEFGTGLKYAIAVLLRTDHKIDIYSAGEHYAFTTSTEEIRGKTFQMVLMDRAGSDKPWDRQLGFTTELGKHWEPWMAYRELWSNTVHDEQGQVLEVPAFDGEEARRQSADGRTYITVSGPLIDQIHKDRADFIIDRNGGPLWACETLEIWPRLGEPHSVFYRGIMVYKSKERPMFRYNILAPVTLTEDRTAQNHYEIDSIIARALLNTDFENAIAAIFTGDYEKALDYNWYTDPSPAVAEAALNRIRGKHSVPDSLRLALRRYAPERAIEAETEVPDNFGDMLSYAPDYEPLASLKARELVNAASSALYDLREALTSAQTSADYWKKCAMKLAGYKEPEATTKASPTDEA